MTMRKSTKMSNEYNKEKAITKIVQETGYDENTVNCWYENYQTLPCRAIQGCCENKMTCMLLEGKGYRRKWG